ncbi:MAG: cytochrome c [Xanthomonadales bacterium]|nr:cytochrome c [Xanthomonadales bacterium]
MKPRTVALLLTCLALAACERAMHDMYAQPKNDPQTPNTMFPDGSSARVPPEGSVARAAGEQADSSSGRMGHVVVVPDPGRAVPLDEGGRPLAPQDATPPANPIVPTLAVLQRGRERFDIYCAPCHGRSGDGAGMIVQRGFPAPPSYHTTKLRNAPDGHFYQVISHGYGAMYPYADRIAPADRWAIIDYIRALQLSQNAGRDLLAPQDLAELARPHAPHPASERQP